LFPNDPILLPVKATFSSTDVTIVRLGSNTPQIFLCVTYEFEVSKQVHTSAVVYTIYKGSVRSQNAICAAPDGSELILPSSALAFVPSPEAAVAD
jgi:hypothetical protein